MTRSLMLSSSRRKKWKKKAKGFFVNNSFKLKEQVMRSLQEAFRGRKEKKKQFRRLWITRLNNYLHSEENKKYQLNYSRFINLLKKNPDKVEKMSLKSLSEISIHYPEKFSNLLNILTNNKESSKNESN